MTREEVLSNLINKAISEHQEAYEEEEANDFDDAMESMERKYLEGYADGLAHAYHIAFGETNV